MALTDDDVTYPPPTVNRLNHPGGDASNPVTVSSHVNVTAMGVTREGAPEDDGVNTGVGLTLSYASSKACDRRLASLVETDVAAPANATTRSVPCAVDGVTRR